MARRLSSDLADSRSASAMEIRSLRFPAKVGSLQCPLAQGPHRSSKVLRAWLVALTGHMSAAVLMVFIAGFLTPTGDRNFDCFGFPCRLFEE